MIEITNLHSFSALQHPFILWEGIENNCATSSFLRLNHTLKMSADLSYNKVFSGTVTQQTDITVLGESGSTQSPDHTVVINVSQTEIKKLLAYSSKWNPATTDQEGEQPLPDIKMPLSHAISAKLNKVTADMKMAQMNGDFSGLASGDRVFLDDNGTTHPAFPQHLLDAAFTGSIFDTTIPKVAIRAIDEAEPTVENLASTLGDLDTLTGDSNTKHAMEALFEQAVAAGRVTSSDGEHYLGGGYKCPSFVAGDSITVYVNYSLIKTRSYTVDSSKTEFSSLRAAIVGVTVNGVSFSVDTSSIETSDPLSKLYAFKLLFAGPSSRWD